MKANAEAKLSSLPPPHGGHQTDVDCLSAKRHRLGIESIPPLSARELGISRAERPIGGLVIAGSYVPTTIAQVARLMERRASERHAVTLPVPELLQSAEAA